MFSLLRCCVNEASPSTLIQHSTIYGVEVEEPLEREQWHSVFIWQREFEPNNWKELISISAHIPIRPSYFTGLVKLTDEFDIFEFL